MPSLELGQTAVVLAPLPQLDRGATALVHVQLLRLGEVLVDASGELLGEFRVGGDVVIRDTELDVLLDDRGPDGF